MASTSSVDSPPDGYLLQRGNWAASARLTFQHHLYKQRYGFLLHPTIASALGFDGGIAQHVRANSNNEPLQVLDFAGGNGIWALDLASSLPDDLKKKVQITCLDISDAQFPPRVMCPDNVTFGTHDVFDEVPEDYVGKFDLVAVRLLTPALFKPGSKELATRNLVKMVKRGGWMQWQESGVPPWQEVVWDRDGYMAGQKYSPEWKVVKKHLGFMQKADWQNQLDRVMAEDGGLVDTLIVPPEFRKDLLVTETEIVQWTLQEGHEGLKKKFPTEEQWDDYIKSIEEAGRNLKAGTLYTLGTRMAIGRKP